MTDPEKLLRDDLHRAADTLDIPISLDAVLATSERLARTERRRRWARRALLLAVLGALLAVGVWWTRTPGTVPDTGVPLPWQTPQGGTSASAAPPTPTGAATATPATTGTPTASTPAGRTVGTFVYYVAAGSDGSTPRLVREYRQVAADTPARGAVEAMLAGPVDPDYTTLWASGTRVLGLSRSGTTITVDLSAEARGTTVGSGYESLMVAQLVHTLTEVFEDTDGVLIRVEGSPLETGHDRYDTPLTRASAEASPLLLVIDSPAHGAVVDAPVTVSGLAAAFEASLHWTLSRTDGTTVAQGNASSEEGMTLAPFSFALPQVPAGEYVLTVTLDDPSDGQAGPPPSDTKTFTLR